LTWSRESGVTVRLNCREAPRRIESSTADVEVGRAERVSDKLEEGDNVRAKVLAVHQRWDGAAGNRPGVIAHLRAASRASISAFAGCASSQALNWATRS
jgi:hypothetical protein